MRRELQLACFVLLPVLGIAAGIVRGELHAARSERFVFDVRGYDPRDLLHGQYLNYRIELHDEATRSVCANSDPDCCLCLTPRGEADPPAVARQPCELARQACHTRMPTTSLERISRFYIPEARARELTTKLREAAQHDSAKIVVAIDPAGAPQVQNLLLDGVPIRTN